MYIFKISSWKVFMFFRNRDDTKLAQKSASFLIKITYTGQKQTTATLHCALCTSLAFTSNFSFEFKLVITAFSLVWILKCAIQNITWKWMKTAWKQSRTFFKSIVLCYQIKLLGVSKSADSLHWHIYSL